MDIRHQKEPLCQDRSQGRVHAGGSYGCAAVRPGRCGARDDLSAPIADKVFFAGEAMGGNRSALVNGAYESGRKAAKKISKSLAGLSNNERQG